MALGCVVEDLGIVVGLREAIVRGAETHRTHKFVPRFVILTWDKGDIAGGRGRSDAQKKRACDKQEIAYREHHDEVG